MSEIKTDSLTPEDPAITGSTSLDDDGSDVAVVESADIVLALSNDGENRLLIEGPPTLGSQENDIAGQISATRKTLEALTLDGHDNSEAATQLRQILQDLEAQQSAMIADEIANGLQDLLSE